MTGPVQVNQAAAPVSGEPLSPFQLQMWIIFAGDQNTWERQRPQRHSIEKGALIDISGRDQQCAPDIAPAALRPLDDGDAT